MRVALTDRSCCWRWPRRPQRRRRWSSSGDFDVADLRHRRAGRRRAGCSSTEQAGRVRLVRRRRRCGRAVPRPDVEHAEPPTRSAGCCRSAFAPDYATSRPLLRLSDRRSRARASIAGPGVPRARRPTRTSPTRPPGGCCSPIPHTEAANHNGGQLQFGPDGKLWLGTGDGGGGNDQFGHSQDPGSLLGKLLRLDPARARAGDRRARAAQPVAVLVRPRDGPARDRRRRPGRGRGDRRRRSPPTTAGRASRATHPTHVAIRGCDGGTTAPGADEDARRRRLLLDHRRLRRARSRPAVAARPLPLRRLLRSGACARSTSANPGERRRRSGSTVELAELVRRGRVRAHPRRLAGRTGLPAGRRRAVGVSSSALDRRPGSRRHPRLRTVRARDRVAQRAADAPADVALRSDESCAARRSRRAIARRGVVQATARGARAPGSARWCACG